MLAGPGTGKSTTCAGVFSELKWRGIDCEIATEYAKDKVWERSFDTLNCQTYVFGKQLHRMFRLRGKVEAIITDSPLLLSLIYDERKLPSFTQLVLDEFYSFYNINIFLKRIKKYNPNGRMQTEKEAKAIDRKIQKLLKTHDIPYSSIVGCRESVQDIADIIEESVLKERQKVV